MNNEYISFYRMKTVDELIHLQKTGIARLETIKAVLEEKEKGDKK